MISASDAKRRTQEQLNYMASIEVDNVMEQIEKAISNGKFVLYMDGSLSKHCRETLEKLGYKVGSGSQYNESYYTVSWE